MTDPTDDFGVSIAGWDPRCYLAGCALATALRATLRNPELTAAGAIKQAGIISVKAADAVLRELSKPPQGA
jgi:hypothetical protein